MIEYFYTLDLGKTYGPKLEALAAEASFDDVEAFAAMVLCHALDLMKALDQADDAVSALRRVSGKSDAADPDSELDEDLPF